MFFFCIQNQKMGPPPSFKQVLGDAGSFLSQSTGISDFEEIGRDSSHLTLSQKIELGIGGGLMGAMAIASVLLPGTGIADRLLSRFVGKDLLRQTLASSVLSGIVGGLGSSLGTYANTGNSSNIMKNIGEQVGMDAGFGFLGIGASKTLEYTQSSIRKYMYNRQVQSFIRSKVTAGIDKTVFSGTTKHTVWDGFEHRDPVYHVSNRGELDEFNKRRGELVQLNKQYNERAGILKTQGIGTDEELEKIDKDRWNKWTEFRLKFNDVRYEDVEEYQMRMDERESFLKRMFARKYGMSINPNDVNYLWSPNERELNVEMSKTVIEPADQSAFEELFGHGRYNLFYIYRQLEFIS